jgi:hypothetical protein
LRGRLYRHLRIEYGSYGSATADGVDVLKQQVIDKMPIAELTDALSKLDDFAAPAQRT